MEREKNLTTQVVNGVPYLFDFWFQVTRNALLTEEGLLESLDDSPFQVALQSWRKLHETKKHILTIQLHCHKNDPFRSAIIEKPSYTAKGNIDI